MTFKVVTRAIESCDKSCVGTRGTLLIQPVCPSCLLQRGARRPTGPGGSRRNTQSNLLQPPCSSWKILHFGNSFFSFVLMDNGRSADNLKETVNHPDPV